MSILCIKDYIKSSSLEGLDNINSLEDKLKEQQQYIPHTLHTLHGGVYTRTVYIKDTVLLTNTLIKIPTTIIVNGDISITDGDSTTRYIGYNVLPASKNRKQAYYIHSPTYITMVFSTEASTITEAEQEFSYNIDELLSRREDAMNTIIITGE